MSPVRLGFDARYVNDQFHEIGRYAFNLIETMSRLASSIDFVVFQGKGVDSRFDLRQLAKRPNVKLVAGPYPLYWPTEQFSWLKHLERENIRIFHSPYFVAPILASNKMNVIVTVHDLIFDRYREYIPQAWARTYYRMMMRKSLLRANKIVAVSQATAKDLVQFYPFTNGKIEVFKEGVQAGYEEKADRATIHALREKYKLNHPFLLTVGARRPHKNLGRLVRAYSLLTKHIDHHLVLVGPQDRRFPDEAVAEVNRLNLFERVHFLNWIPEQEMPILYRMADMVVLPSIIEGFGLPALEAIAGGTVVAAADNGAYGEVLGDAGIFFDPQHEVELANAIQIGLTNFKVRQRLMVAGLSRSQKYSWEDIALKTLALYDELLK